ncbi:uncharacterized protein LOC127130542 [Lathyrus oleraceus]|uniref:uncharacterized protein LOC127130542 n=1 Tax=Pisum sativum TaxID=3888 RepID=UPI0021CE5EE4|nr:uncharacterized protein LOC127130542 [Pisum sativum]
MNYVIRGTCSYKFVEPQLRTLKGLGTRLVLDNKEDFKNNYGDLLSILNTEVNITIIHTRVQLYDPPTRCFTFQDHQLAPTLEEYSQILGVEIHDQVPFVYTKELPKSHHITEVLNLEKKEVEINLQLKGGTYGFTLKFLVDKPTTFADAGSWNSFNVIIAFLIYGIVLFPNMGDFMDLAFIHIFMTKNHVHTLLDDTYYSVHVRNQNKKGTIMCCVPMLYRWFMSHLSNKGPFLDNKSNLK